MAKFTQDRMYEMLGDIYKSSTKKHAKKIGIDYLSEFARGGGQGLVYAEYGGLNNFAEGGALNKFVGGGNPTCEKPYVWNPETNRCEKKSGCPENFHFDPKSGRCISNYQKETVKVMSAAYKYDKDGNKLVFPTDYDDSEFSPVSDDQLDYDKSSWPKDYSIKGIVNPIYFVDHGSILVSAPDYVPKYPGDSQGYIETYPDLNYKVVVDSTKPEGYNKDESIYYVKSENTHQFKKYKEWEKLKKLEKDNIDNAKKLGLVMTEDESPTSVRIQKYPQEHYKTLKQLYDDEGNDVSSYWDNESYDFKPGMKDVYENDLKTLQELYNDPEYLGHEVYNKSFDETFKDRGTKNIERYKALCPHCRYYHGQRMTIDPDYIYDTFNPYQNPVDEGRFTKPFYELEYDYADPTIESMYPQLEFEEGVDPPDYYTTPTEIEIPKVRMEKGNVKAIKFNLPEYHKNNYLTGKTDAPPFHGKKSHHIKYRPRHLDFGRRDMTRLIPKIVQKATGYDEKYMQGYYDDEGNYFPGEIEKAEEEGRQINFKGASSLRDIKQQKIYNEKWTNSEEQNKLIRQQNEDLLKEYGLTREEYVKLYGEFNNFEYGGLQKFITGGASYQCPTGEYWNGVRCVPNYGVNPLGQSAINGFLSNTSTYNNAKIKELESKGLMYIKTQQQKDELNALYAKKAKIAEEDRKYNQKLQKEKLAKQRLLDEERNAQINPNKYYSETVQSVAGNKPSPTSGILSNFNFDVNNINFDAIEKRDREEAEKARLAAFEALSPEEKRKAIEAGFAEEDKLLDAKSKMYSQYFEDNKYYRPLSNAFASDNTEVFNPLGPSSLEQNRNNYFIKETEQEDFMMNEVLPFSKIKESHYKNVEKSKGDPKGDRYNEAIEAQNKWHQQNGPNPTYNGGEMFDYNKQNWEMMKHKFNDGYDSETKLYITPRGTYNPATKVYTPNRIGYQSSGAVEMLYPEQYAIGAMGARSALIPLGEMVYAKVGASALGQGIKAAWNTALPYTAGQLTTGNAVGLGFGMHGITTIKPNLDKFIAKPSLETGTDLAFSTVEVLGSPGVGKAIMAGVKPLIAVSKAGFNGAGALYNDIATGNSILPVAWKVDRPLINLKSSDYISRQFTAAEAALVSKYGKGMNLTPEEWIEMENLVNSGATDFTQAATPISRIPLYYNRSEAATKEAEEISKLKLWQSYATPTEKNIRTWSAGVPELYDAERLARAREIDKTRLVIPRKYTKNLGDNFTGMPYDDARVDFIHPEGGGFNEFASKENELMGNIPEGFRVIGKSKENGYNNIIIRPLKNTKTTSVTPASETVAPQSALNAEVSGSGVVADNTSLYKMGSDPNYEYTLLSSDEAALLKSENPNMTNVEILEELVVKGNPNSIYPSGQAGQQAAFEDAGNFAINWAVKDTGKYNEMLSNTTQVDQLTAKINRLESSPVVTKFKAINKSVTDEYRSQRNLTDDEFWVEYNADPAAYRAFASQKWSELMANDSTLSSTVKDYDLIQRSIKGLEAKLSIESENVAKLGEEAIDPIFKEKVIELYRQAGIPEDRIPKYAFINDGKLIRDFNIDRSKLVDMNQFDPLSEPSFAELSDADQMYLANNWQDIGGARTEDATITIGSRIKDKTYYTVRKLGEPQQVLKEVPAEKVIPWKPSTWKNYNAKPKNEITWERPYVEEPTLVEKASKITHDADYIAEVQAHEYGHDTELFYSDWGALTTEYDPTIAAYSSHSKNPLAKRFKDAMVEGKPFDPVTGKRVQGSWESSPNELHAELFRVRFKYYTKMAAENPQLSQKEIIKFMKEAEAADNAEVYDFYLKELSGHFKESTPITERKNLIKLLPALVPAISVGVGVGTSNGTNSETPQNKYGGNIKTLSKFIRK